MGSFYKKFVVEDGIIFDFFDFLVIAKALPKDITAYDSEEVANSADRYILVSQFVTKKGKIAYRENPNGNLKLFILHKSNHHADGHSNVYNADKVLASKRQAFSMSDYLYVVEKDANIYDVCHKELKDVDAVLDNL